MRRSFLSLALVSAVFVNVSTLKSQDSSYDPTNFSTGVFHEGNTPCKQAGDGGDPYLNELKNRDIPPGSYDSITLTDVFDNFPQDLPAGPGKKNYRESSTTVWTDAQRSQVTDFEKKGARIEGFFLEIDSEGPEHCNCESTPFHDFHLWLSPTPLPHNHPHIIDRSNAMVVEISPRLLKGHSRWNPDSIGVLIKNSTRVRVSGWLTWDEEHPANLHPPHHTRHTLWEVHPIHNIEVQVVGKWVDF